MTMNASNISSEMAFSLSLLANLSAHVRCKSIKELGRGKLCDVRWFPDIDRINKEQDKARSIS